jgi:hypothetical protein
MGLAALGGVVTGALGLVAALFPFFDGDFTATGLCLIAAALSFGLLANAVLRD